ncbi:ATP-binding protein [Moraxella canis]|uniref:histidine kinase n=1 Tax=Moraxella canis TaxID=90239 RepID=A0ABZ0WVI2_9GAMM|nr:ATP-binding protein [Moraxella canis]WQE03261.1 ATP-binding protein [Moraxella canis]
MQVNKAFGIKSAYGQLILLVFLPIVVLAFVGSYLVMSEIRRAILAEQDTMAQAALVRYDAMVRPLLTDIQHRQSRMDERVAQMNEDEILSAIAPHDAPALNGVIIRSNEDDSRFFNENWFVQLQQSRNQHVLRVAVMDGIGRVLFSTGMQTDLSWGDFDLQAEQIYRVPTAVGTAYGKSFIFDNERYWLVVDMDNTPLTITSYRVALALTIIGLTTILLLLLILNIYSKRWIAPLYEMRLYLQRLNTDNLSRVPQLRTNGEFALLRDDFARAVRRLHASFTELKNHADETERDLQQAFDEMEMQNISIRNARDAAISASQAKSAFLANISHELRTPLNSIDGFINLLARKGELTGEQNLYVQTIKKSSAHLLALVNDVLDFSKMEAGKLILDSHDFDLYAAVYDVVDMLSPAALEKRLRLAVLYYDDVPTRVVGDSLRVKQILTNLVGNAIKFTDTGGVVVRASLADQSGYLRIEVEDTGKGVSESDKAQLFQSFGQGDLSVTRRYGGTGLGLVISKQLTHLMGGAIGFFDNRSENIANAGATFWFEMPTGVHEASFDEASIQIPETLNLPMHLLVWINHAPALQVLRASLMGTKVQLTIAIGLADLLEKLDKKDTEYDWVIVDNFGQDAAKDDVGAILRQIRLRYQGKLASFGYQVGINEQLISRYQTHALHEPMDKRQLYAMLSNQQNIMTMQSSRQAKFVGRRILAVDDHLPNLLVLDALLGELGVEVVTANSGFDAIEKMTQSITGAIPPIDMIFMDVQMPRMSGLEASIEIRKIEETHLVEPVPIVALTAHGLSDEKDRLVAAGLNDYVSKPIGEMQLVQTLQKWLGRSGESADDLDVSAVFESLPVVDVADQPSDAADGLIDVDWQDALERSANKPKLAYKLLEMIIDSADGERQAIERAWADRDRQSLADISHRMVGAARYAGVPRLRAVSERFESECRRDLSAVSASQFIAMRPTYRALIDALDALQAVDLSKIVPADVEITQ